LSQTKSCVSEKHRQQNNPLATSIAKELSLAKVAAYRISKIVVIEKK
jgi:hypothetical protein